VGLTIQIRAAFPAYAATITAVVVFAVVGPQALFAAGEAKAVPESGRPLAAR
jgi:hypothetical protein